MKNQGEAISSNRQLGMCLHQDSSDNGVMKVSKSDARVSCTAQHSVSSSQFCNFTFP